MSTDEHSPGWKLLSELPYGTHLYIDELYENKTTWLTGYNLYCIYHGELYKVVVPEMEAYVEGEIYTYSTNSILNTIISLGRIVHSNAFHFREIWISG